MAHKVISGPEAPNNNSSGQQFVPHRAINVHSSIEVSNNSGLQLVPQAAINTPSSIEVPINSGPQLVPEAAINIPSSTVVPINSGPQNPDGAASISERAIANGTAELAMSTAVTDGDIMAALEDGMPDLEDGMPDLEDGRNLIAHLAPTRASKNLLSESMWKLSYFTLFILMNLGIHQPADTGLFSARHRDIYYGILAAMAAAVPSEMTTAFWLPRSHGWSFYTFAEVLQRVGVVLLIIASAVGGIELILKA